MRPAVCFLLMVLSVGTAWARKPIVQFQLDEFVVYSIPVALEKGNTTFVFPSPISAIYASKTAPQQPNQAPETEFLISFQPGSSFFAVRALKPEAEDYLTVVYRGKPYVIRIKADEKPHFTVTFYTGELGSRGASGGAAVPPARLLALLDKAKLYPALEAHAPDALAGVTQAKPARINYYPKFRVFLQDVWRFEEEDTLVFHIRLENKTDEPVYYAPQNLAVRVRDRVYSASVSDASGVIPARSLVPAFFAITGNPAGGKNYLAPDNTWDVLVTETAAPPPLHRTSGQAK